MDIRQELQAREVVQLIRRLKRKGPHPRPMGGDKRLQDAGRVVEWLPPVFIIDEQRRTDRHLGLAIGKRRILRHVLGRIVVGHE